MVGTTISHYRILERLGGGGMGVVYRAQDLKLDRTVALKFLPSDLTRDPEAKARFVHEARAASALEHSNICNIHEIDETADGQMFIAMAFYDGETVKKKIERGPLPLNEALDIAIQTAQGLLNAHQEGMVHRDVKPANVMVTSDGVAKLVDFGLAKLTGMTRLTRTGTSVGTAGYMSPEQTRGENVDRRTDIWSLGVMLYEMVTGRLPFQGDYGNAVVYSILNTTPEPLTAVRTGVPMELERIVEKAMAKDPSERYQHVDEMLVDLRHLQKERESGARPAPGPPSASKKRNWKKILIPAAAGAGLLAALLVLLPIFSHEILVSEPKPIAVVTFINQTGDRTLDYLAEAIPNLLITNLEQSRYLRVMTWERMHDLLAQMGKKEVTAIDKELGFELCRLEGVHAIVTGTFTKAGGTFVTDVKVLDVDTKELLRTASARGEGVGSILESQIDDLSREISRGIGLSQRKIESAPQQIAEVTTSSMDAYNYYLRGRDELDKMYYRRALEFLGRAVALDSNFAMAYLSLANCYSNLFDWDAQTRAIQKAMTLSKRAPEKERLSIEARYADFQRNPEKTRQLREELVAKFPMEKRFHDNLGLLYQDRKLMQQAQQEFEKAIQLDPTYASAVNNIAYLFVDLGNYEKAIEFFQRYASLSPGDANPFDSMAELYLVMGRLDESIARYSEAIRVQPSFSSAYKGLAYVHALKEEYSESLRWLDSLLIAAAPTPGIRADATYAKATYLAAIGKVREARRQSELGIRLIAAMGDRRAFVIVYFVEAQSALSERKVDVARHRLAQFFESYEQLNPRTPLYNAVQRNTFLGFLELAAGHTDIARTDLMEAKANAGSVENTNPSLDMMLSSLEAEVLLAEGLPDSAIRFYRSAPVAPPRMGTGWRMPMYNIPRMRDVIPRAFQARGEPDSAITEYERLLRVDPSNLDRRLISPRFHYRLAKLCEQTGRTDKARTEYARFLELWKNADPDQPDLIDARRRLASLHR